MSARIGDIGEEPRRPKSNCAITAIYIYDGTVFERSTTLVSSHRGELEITDVTPSFAKEL